MPHPSPPPSDRDPRPVVALFRSPVFNASETFVRAQAVGLERYRPLVIGLEDKGNFPPSLQDGPLLPHSVRERMAIRLIGRWGRLADAAAAHAPVLVHAHFAPDGLIALPLAEALGVPLVTTLHGYDVARSRGRLLASGRLSWMRYALLQRRLMRSGALFLAVSEALRQQAIERGFPADRTRTHYLGVDLEAFRPGSEPPEPGLILHVGRLVEKKGTAVLLEALALLQRRGTEARLLVIGEGPELPSLKRRAGALGLDHVIFAGALPADQVAAWMRRAWLLAAPSLTARDGDAEGLPTVIVEAAASAVPSIGSDHAGIPEAIRDGETGFVVAERDAEALAFKLAKLIGSAELRARMGDAARKLAEERFDAARQIRRLEEIYDGLAGQIRP